jgi:hypothetical protein
MASGELKAWQPNRDGKLIMRRSAPIEWATRRPAADRQQPERRRERRQPKPSSRARRGTAASTQVPDPISLPDLA